MVSEKVVPYSEKEHDFLFTFERQDFIMGKTFHINDYCLIDKIRKAYLNYELSK